MTQGQVPTACIHITIDLRELFKAGVSCGDAGPTSDFFLSHGNRSLERGRSFWVGG